MTDNTSKTVRDLEKVLRQEFGFSTRRSKAGAAEAWKALNINLVPQTNMQTSAEFFMDFPNLIKAKLIPPDEGGRADLQMIYKCEHALGLMRSALAEIDESGSQSDADAHLSLAIHRLEEAVAEAKRHERPASGSV